MMNTWNLMEKHPEKPGNYWTCTIVRGFPAANGVITVRHSGGDWMRWDGMNWIGDAQPTHWYGEVKA